MQLPIFFKKGKNPHKHRQFLYFANMKNVYCVVNSYNNDNYELEEEASVEDNTMKELFKSIRALNSYGASLLSSTCLESKNVNIIWQLNNLNLLDLQSEVQI